MLLSESTAGFAADLCLCARRREAQGDDGSVAINLLRAASGHGMPILSYNNQYA